MNGCLKNGYTQKNKELVIYGCGENAIRFLNFIDEAVAKCVDSDKNKQFKIFADKYIIEDPSVLDGKSEKYNVIVTPDHAEAIYKILDRYGYVYNVDYFCIETYFYIRILSYFVKRKDSVKFILAPNLLELPYLTELEQSLLKLPLAMDIDGDYRVKWLKSYAPHIKKCYKNFDYYSDEYIQNIFLPVPVYEVDGVLFQDDCKSKYVNCMGGIELQQTNQKNMM